MNTKSKTIIQLIALVAGGFLIFEGFTRFAAAQNAERAEALARAGRFQQALSAYETALGYRQEAEILVQAGTLAYSRSRPDAQHPRQDFLGAASRYAKAAIEQDAFRSEAWQLHGKVLLAQNRPEEALAAFETAIRLDPHNHLDYYAGAARAARDAGDRKKALTVVNAALKKITPAMEQHMHNFARGKVNSPTPVVAQVKHLETLRALRQELQP